MKAFLPEPENQALERCCLFGGVFLAMAVSNVLGIDKQYVLIQNITGQTRWSQPPAMRFSSGEENKSPRVDAGHTGKSGKNEMRYRVQSVGRALDLLDLIAEHGMDGARLSDLARSLSISKAATHAMLQTLLARDFIADINIGAGRRYRLGLALAHLGDRAISNISLADIAVPVLRELTAKVDCTSRVAVLDDGFAVVVGRVDAPGAIRFDAALGRHELPHSSAVGKALLAALPVAQARAIIEPIELTQRTPHTITRIKVLMEELQLIRQRGYAIDDEEDCEGVLCVGTCVFDKSGAAAGAISFSSIKHGNLDSRLKGYIATLIQFADRISHQLGGPAGEAAWRMRHSENNNR